MHDQTTQTADSEEANSDDEVSGDATGHAERNATHAVVESDPNGRQSEIVTFYFPYSTEKYNLSLLLILFFLCDSTGRNMATWRMAAKLAPHGHSPEVHPKDNQTTSAPHFKVRQ